MNKQRNQVKMDKNSRYLVQNIKEFIGDDTGFDSLCEESIREIHVVNSKREYPVSISWSYSPNLQEFLVNTVSSGKSRYWYSKDDSSFQYFNQVVPKMIGNWVIHGSRFYPDNYVETIGHPDDQENALIGAVLHQMLRSGLLKRDETLLLDQGSREIFSTEDGVVQVILTLWVWNRDTSHVKCIEEGFLIDFRNGKFNSSGKNYDLCKDEVVREFSDQSLEQDYEIDEPDNGEEEYELTL